MNETVAPITFDRVRYRWTGSEETAASADADADADADAELVLADVSLDLPAGLGFLVGPNGIGKSTLMLLAGGRIVPDTGTVLIAGRNSQEFADAHHDVEREAARNRLVSFVYQNMELEADEPIGDLFDVVSRASVDPVRAESARAELVAAADLKDRLAARMQELSKGEMQRAIFVMSLLWGSPIVMMDEPLFAVESWRAEQLLEAVRAHCAKTGTTVYTSVHDVKLAQRFADHVVLFDADRTITVGEPGELLTRQRLERAFRAPWDTLYERQYLYRDLLKKSFAAEELPERDS